MLAALHEFHQPQDQKLPAILHRRLSPTSLRVRHNNQLVGRLGRGGIG
ncbi:hypothetical protein [uncultured Thiodictyon sp.]|nr:hypothetical protein [uncultured Thiodictyon sp.]